eukprot:gene539-576_t
MDPEQPYHNIQLLAGDQQLIFYDGFGNPSLNTPVTRNGNVYEGGPGSVWLAFPMHIRYYEALDSIYFSEAFPTTVHANYLFGSLAIRKLSLATGELEMFAGEDYTHNKSVHYKYIGTMGGYHDGAIDKASFIYPISIDVSRSFGSFAEVVVVDFSARALRRTTLRLHPTAAPTKHNNYEYISHNKTHSNGTGNSRDEYKRFLFISNRSFIYLFFSKIISEHFHLELDSNRWIPFPAIVLCILLVGVISPVLMVLSALLYCCCPGRRQWFGSSRGHPDKTRLQDKPKARLLSLPPRRCCCSGLDLIFGTGRARWCGSEGGDSCCCCGTDSQGYSSTVQYGELDVTDHSQIMEQPITGYSRGSSAGSGVDMSCHGPESETGDMSSEADSASPQNAGSADTSPPWQASLLSLPFSRSLLLPSRHVTQVHQGKGLSRRRRRRRGPSFSDDVELPTALQIKDLEMVSQVRVDPNKGSLLVDICDRRGRTTEECTSSGTFGSARHSPTVKGDVETGAADGSYNTNGGNTDGSRQPCGPPSAPSRVANLQYGDGGDSTDKGTPSSFFSRLGIIQRLGRIINVEVASPVREMTYLPPFPVTPVKAEEVGGEGTDTVEVGTSATTGLVATGVLSPAPLRLPRNQNQRGLGGSVEDEVEMTISTVETEDGVRVGVPDVEDDLETSLDSLVKFCDEEIMAYKSKAAVTSIAITTPSVGIENARCRPASGDLSKNYPQINIESAVTKTPTNDVCQVETPFPLPQSLELNCSEVIPSCVNGGDKEDCYALNTSTSDPSSEKESIISKNIAPKTSIFHRLYCYLWSSSPSQGRAGFPTHHGDYSMASTDVLDDLSPSSTTSALTRPQYERDKSCSQSQTDLTPPTAADPCHSISHSRTSSITPSVLFPNDSENGESDFSDVIEDIKTGIALQEGGDTPVKEDAFVIEASLPKASLDQFSWNGSDRMDSFGCDTDRDGCGEAAGEYRRRSFRERLESS